MAQPLKIQDLYHSYRPLQTIRGLVKTRGEYILLKANRGLNFESNEITWPDGSNATFDGTFYVLSSYSRMNGYWQHHGRIYETSRQVLSLVASNTFCLVVKKELADELNELIQNQDQANLFDAWQQFCERSPSLDTDNWLNFINFVNFLKKEKKEKKLR